MWSRGQLSACVCYLPTFCFFLMRLGSWSSGALTVTCWTPALLPTEACPLSLCFSQQPCFGAGAGRWTERAVAAMARRGGGVLGRGLAAWPAPLVPRCPGCLRISADCGWRLRASQGGPARQQQTGGGGFLPEGQRQKQRA